MTTSTKGKHHCHNSLLHPLLRLSVLPSYIKSASQSAHQLYSTSPEAYSNLGYLEHFTHATGHFCQHVTSMTTRTASDIRDIGGVVGAPPPSPPSTQPSPASPQQPLGPLDDLRKPNIINMFSEFHIKRDATDLAPPSMDIKGIYNKFEEPSIKPDLNIKQVIAQYFRACSTSQNDHKIAYIVLYDSERFLLNQHDRIRLTNIDPLLQAGYPNLY